MRAIQSAGTIRLMICENNEQGDPSGKVCQIDVEDPRHEEVCLSVEHEAFFQGGTPFGEWAHRRISLHGYVFTYNHRQTWVGNMMWNEYALPIAHAVGLLNVLRRSGEWEPRSGLTDLLARWDQGEDMTCADFGFTAIPWSDQTGVGFHRSGRQLMLFGSDQLVGPPRSTPPTV